MDACILHVSPKTPRSMLSGVLNAIFDRLSIVGAESSEELRVRLLEMCQFLIQKVGHEEVYSVSFEKSILNCLKDESSAVCVAACKYVLGNVCNWPDSITRALVLCLDHKHWKVRAACVACLSNHIDNMYVFEKLCALVVPSESAHVKNAVYAAVSSSSEWKCVYLQALCQWDKHDLLTDQFCAKLCVNVCMCTVCVCICSHCLSTRLQF